MNEVLAENRFLLTKALFFEGMRCVWRERNAKSIRTLLLILALAWAGFAAYTLWRGGDLLLPAAELLLLALIALWATVWLPGRRAQRAYRALEERGAADTERVTRFYADRLEVEEGGRLTSVAYSDLLQTLHSRNLLILIAGDKTGVLVKHDSYTVGAGDTVLRLLKKGA